MNNSQKTLFSAAIQEATYFDVNCLISLFHGADSPVEYWSLMQPDNLRQIIVSTEQRLLKICLQCLQETYECAPQHSSRSMAIKPSLQMMSELKSFISSDLNVIGKEINQYEYSYQLFANSRQKYENGLIRLHDMSQATPVLSGGMRETWTSQTVPPEIELNAAQQEFERRNQQISIKFSDTLQKTTIYLEGMQTRTLQAISSYGEHLI